MVKTQDKKRFGYQQKLESRGVKGVLLGYDDKFPLFTYKVYIPDEEKIIMTRNVKFDESKSIYQRGSNYDELENFSEEEGEDELDEDAEAIDVEMTNDEPTSYEEAVKSNESAKWIAAIDDKLTSMAKNQTWTLVALPPGRKPVKSKWVFKLKLKSTGEIERYKARLVACGYSQKAGVDYKETFGPVVRTDSIRLLLILANQFDLDILQMDVKTAFLYGLAEELHAATARSRKRGGFGVQVKSLYLRIKASELAVEQMLHRIFARIFFAAFKK